MLDKKGSVIFEFADGIIGIILFVAFTILVVTALNIFNTKLATQDVSQEAKDSGTSGYTGLTGILNFVPLVLYFGLIFVSVQLLKMNNENPIMLIIWFLLLIGYVGTLLILPSSFYEGLKNSSSVVSNVADDMPIFDYMITNSLLFGALYFIITGVSLFIRKENTGGSFQ